MGTEGDTELVAAALASITPSGVRPGVRAIDERDLAGLHPIEVAAVRTAAAVRQREFASGRALLRTLIGRDIPIPKGTDRRPVLPGGVAGSIAHDRQVVVGIVAPTTVARAVGIDIERRSGVEPDVAAAVVRPDDEVDDPILAFVAKEAAFKAWSNGGGRLLDHLEMRIVMALSSDSHRGTFAAVVVDDDVEFRGAVTAAGDAWLALVVSM